MTPLGPETDLDRELDRRLRALPGPKAPGTLMPRVMAAAARAPVTAELLVLKPWYARPWLAWPLSLRLASAIVVTAVAVTLFAGAPILRWLSPNLAADLSRAFDPIQSLGRYIGQVGTLTRVFWHVWLEPIALYLLALIVMLSLAVTAALSLVNRLTPERT
jgi:hypothetical protein